MAQDLHVASVDGLPLGLAIGREALTDRVYQVASRAVMELGELLLQGRQEMGRGLWEIWVDDELPFGLETAKRYVAIYQAYSNLAPETLAALPKPWQALYALRAVDQTSLVALVKTGEISTRTTIKESRSLVRKYKQDRWTGSADSGAPGLPTPADQVAVNLMGYDPSELSPKLRMALGSWLDS